MENTQKVFVPEPKELWNYLVEKGAKVEEGYQANSFDENDLNTVLGTMDFFGATSIWLSQTAFDLSKPRFRLFDWLAMCVMSRNDDNRQQNREALRVLVWSWLKVEGDPKAFIADLRETDYQLDTSYDAVKFKDEEAEK